MMNNQTQSMKRKRKNRLDSHTIEDSYLQFEDGLINEQSTITVNNKNSTKVSDGSDFVNLTINIKVPAPPGKKRKKLIRSLVSNLSSISPNATMSQSSVCNDNSEQILMPQPIKVECFDESDNKLHRETYAERIQKEYGINIDQRNDVDSTQRNQDNDFLSIISDIGSSTTNCNDRVLGCKKKKVTRLSFNQIEENLKNCSTPSPHFSTPVNHYNDLLSCPLRQEPEQIDDKQILCDPVSQISTLHECSAERNHLNDDEILYDPVSQISTLCEDSKEKDIPKDKHRNEKVVEETLCDPVSQISTFHEFFNVKNVPNEKHENQQSVEETLCDPVSQISTFCEDICKQNNILNDDRKLKNIEFEEESTIVTPKSDDVIPITHNVTSLAKEKILNTAVSKKTSFETFDSETSSQNTKKKKVLANEKILTNVVSENSLFEISDTEISSQNIKKEKVKSRSVSERKELNKLKKQRKAMAVNDSVGFINTSDLMTSQEICDLVIDLCNNQTSVAKSSIDESIDIQGENKPSSLFNRSRDKEFTGFSSDNNMINVSLGNDELTPKKSPVRAKKFTKKVNKTKLQRNMSESSSDSEEPPKKYLDSLSDTSLSSVNYSHPESSASESSKQNPIATDILSDTTSDAESQPIRDLSIKHGCNKKSVKSKNEFIKVANRQKNYLNKQQADKINAKYEILSSDSEIDIPAIRKTNDITNSSKNAKKPLKYEKCPFETSDTSSGSEIEIENRRKNTEPSGDDSDKELINLRRALLNKSNSNAENNMTNKNNRIKSDAAADDSDKVRQRKIEGNQKVLEEIPGNQRKKDSEKENQESVSKEHPQVVNDDMSAQEVLDIVMNVYDENNSEMDEKLPSSNEEKNLKNSNKSLSLRKTKKSNNECKGDTPNMEIRQQSKVFNDKTSTSKISTSLAQSKANSTPVFKRKSPRISAKENKIGDAENAQVDQVKPIHKKSNSKDETREIEGVVKEEFDVSNENLKNKAEKKRTPSSKQKSAKQPVHLDKSSKKDNMQELPSDKVRETNDMGTQEILDIVRASIDERNDGQKSKTGKKKMPTSKKKSAKEPANIDNESTTKDVQKPLNDYELKAKDILTQEILDIVTEAFDETSEHPKSKTAKKKASTSKNKSTKQLVNSDDKSSKKNTQKPPSDNESEARVIGTQEILDTAYESFEDINKHQESKAGEKKVQTLRKKSVKQLVNLDDKFSSEVVMEEPSRDKVPEAQDMGTQEILDTVTKAFNNRSKDEGDNQEQEKTMSSENKVVEVKSGNGPKTESTKKSKLALRQNQTKDLKDTTTTTNAEEKASDHDLLKTLDQSPEKSSDNEKDNQTVPKRRSPWKSVQNKCDLIKTNSTVQKNELENQKCFKNSLKKTQDTSSEKKDAKKSNSTSMKKANKSKPIVKFDFNKVRTKGNLKKSKNNGNSIIGYLQDTSKNTTIENQLLIKNNNGNQIEKENNQESVNKRADKSQSSMSLCSMINSALDINNTTENEVVLQTEEERLKELDVETARKNSEENKYVESEIPKATSDTVLALNNSISNEAISVEHSNMQISNNQVDNAAAKGSCVITSQEFLAQEQCLAKMGMRNVEKDINFTIPSNIKDMTILGNAIVNQIETSNTEFEAHPNNPDNLSLLVSEENFEERLRSMGLESDALIDSLFVNSGTTVNNTTIDNSTRSETQANKSNSIEVNAEVVNNAPVIKASTSSTILPSSKKSKYMKLIEKTFNKLLNKRLGKETKQKRKKFDILKFQTKKRKHLKLDDAMPAKRFKRIRNTDSDEERTDSTDGRSDEDSDIAPVRKIINRRKSTSPLKNNFSVKLWDKSNTSTEDTCSSGDEDFLNNKKSPSRCPTIRYLSRYPKSYRKKNIFKFLHQIKNSNEGDSSEGGDISKEVLELLKAARHNMQSLTYYNHLKKLRIRNNFPIPTLHKLALRISSGPTKDEWDAIKRQKITVHDKNFTEKEDFLIYSNFIKFSETYNLEEDPSPFMLKGTDSPLSFNERAKFVQFIGQGLNDRHLHSIHQRFIKLMIMRKTNDFTIEEDKIILKFIDHFKDKNLENALYFILHRSKKAVLQRFEELKRRNENAA